MKNYKLVICGGKFNDTTRYYNKFKTAVKVARMYLTKGKTKEISGRAQFADIYEIDKETGKKLLVYSI